MSLKLNRKVVNGKSFRWNINGRIIKYLTDNVSQKQLQELLDNDCPFVIEEKSKAKAKAKSKKVIEENEETNDGTND